MWRIRDTVKERPELWPTDPGDAIRVQQQLREKVDRADRFGPVRRLAAIDGHYGADGQSAWAAVALFSWPDLVLEQSVLLMRPLRIPYIPGLLSFREAPAMLDALSMLRSPPDLLMVDGHGIAHPRRLGIAAHVGVLTDLPSIGVGKSLLCGRYQEPENEKGSWSPLVHWRETVGAALRTRTGVSPVFVSTGHRVSLPSAIDIVLEATGRWRLPEPIRAADTLSRMHGSPWEQTSPD